MLSLEYTGYIQGLGYIPTWIQSGEFMGTRGQSLCLEGIQVRLKGSWAPLFRVCYQLYLAERGETDVCSDGQFCGTKGESRAAHALRVWVERRV